LFFILGFPLFAMKHFVLLFALMFITFIKTVYAIIFDR
jgi:hypothetical protein